MFKQQDQIQITQKKNWPCKPLKDLFQLGEQLGRGTYGSVYKALHKQKQQYYALKKMQVLEDSIDLGFPISTIRQIKLLQNLSHKNILNINEVLFDKQFTPYRSKTSSPPIIYLCLDIMECDLNFLVREPQYEFTMARIQNIAKQILQGLAYLHSNQTNICHRDIKPSNILISKNGDIKLADFGLAKKMLTKLSTTKVVTMWYRAPELLLGLRSYSSKIDIWSVGCVLAELLIRQPLFKQQKSQVYLINRIFQLMGTPDRCQWQNQVRNLQIFNQIKPNFSKQSEIVYYIKTKAPKYQSELYLLDLIQKMLRLNPTSRFSAEQSLKHQFFSIQFDSQLILDQKTIELKKKEGQQKIIKKVKPI